MMASSSEAERFPVKEDVAGSNPASPVKRKPGRPKGTYKYSQNDIEHALTVLAFSRNHFEAADTLKAEGIIAPPARAIQEWRDHKHTDLYLQIRERTAVQREKLIIDKVLPYAEESFDTAIKAMRVLDRQLEDPAFKDPAGAARNAATTGAILVDKMLVLDGRPTATIEHRNPVEILRLLKERGRVSDSIEGSVEEEQP